MFQTTNQSIFLFVAYILIFLDGLCISPVYFPSTTAVSSAASKKQQSSTVNLQAMTMQAASCRRSCGNSCSE